MWYRGEYYAQDNLSDTITAYHLSHWSTRTRGQRIARRAFKLFFLSPYIAILGFMSVILAEYAVHLLLS